MIKHISLLINNVISPNHAWKITLFQNWEKIIGNLSSKVTILKIDQKIIVLGVTHPVWAQELFGLSEVIKKKINSNLKSNKIEKIIFKVVKKRNRTISRRNKEDIKNNRLNHHDFDNFCLTKNEYIKLSAIRDPELKSSLKQFCFRCKKVGNNDEEAP